MIFICNIWRDFGYNATKELTMKNITSIITMFFCINAIFCQGNDAPAIILLSSTSSPQYIGEMKEHLVHSGIILNVEKELWENQNQLQEFAFTLTNTKTRNVKSFHFKYNDLNRHQVFVVFPTGVNQYDEVISEVGYLRSELLSLLIPMDTRRLKPILHRSYAKSGTSYRESIVLKDLEKIEEELSDTIELYKKIKADQAVGKNLSGLTYTYNGELLNDPKGVNLSDMTADVLIEILSDNSKIINIWSEEPLNELIMSSTIAGQQ